MRVYHLHLDKNRVTCLILDIATTKLRIYLKPVFAHLAGESLKKYGSELCTRFIFNGFRCGQNRTPGAILLAISGNSEDERNQVVGKTMVFYMAI